MYGYLQNLTDCNIGDAQLLRSNNVKNANDRTHDVTALRLQRGWLCCGNSSTNIRHCNKFVRNRRSKIADAPCDSPGCHHHGVDISLPLSKNYEGSLCLHCQDVVLVAPGHRNLEAHVIGEIASPGFIGWVCLDCNYWNTYSLVGTPERSVKLCNSAVCKAIDEENKQWYIEEMKKWGRGSKRGRKPIRRPLYLQKDEQQWKHAMAVRWKRPGIP